jgi:hypothetical protein
MTAPDQLTSGKIFFLATGLTTAERRVGDEGRGLRRHLTGMTVVADLGQIHIED